jgi:hypothetical protein
VAIGTGSSARGQLQNTTHLGDLFHGSVSSLTCSHDGGAGPGVPPAPWNTAEIHGVGTWNHQTGYSFRLLVHDRGEPGRNNDEYALEIFDAAGALIYSESAVIAGGNIQLHTR